ncbi:MAG: DNA topoisomerase (ATP-hydrolyzing) subunit A [Bacilli bacterium]
MQNDITKELGTNFIEYAVAVNTDRAIPDATCGLKPVARRILWSAFESGRSSSKPHVKSGMIVGDVMGKYHPHGDSSIYGALVRLSQDWIMRYPLIDWHGNNGNIAGDGAAHYRYTESRLSKIAEDGLLSGLKKRNVDFTLNYTDTLEEPVTLPSIFPNLLCNPNSGIGVAMACNWLPHNLREVAQAIFDYLDGKEPSLPGPDFPTGGVIINKNDINNIMKTGHGSVKVRGKYKIEKEKNIIFYEIPYGTTIEGLLTEIGKVCDEKEIEGISEIRDESNKKGLRIVIECQKGINPEIIVQKLFNKTNLQTSISYNQVALINKTPTELNLKQCIEIYLQHNINCLKKETEFDLIKAQSRLEIVQGLLIALEDIDNIITKIKTSDNATVAKQMLINDYKMSENQAKAVLDMKLAKLAKLEKIEIEKEKEELINTIDILTNILNNKDKQQEIIKEKLSSFVKKYGDERRTELLQIEIQKEEKEIIEVIPEDCVVVINQTGDIKRVAKKTFRVQKRNGKGIKNEDEALLDTISTNTIDKLMIFTEKGKMYQLLVDNIPEGTNTSKGVNINTLINLEPEDRVMNIASLDRKSDAKYVIFITKQGLIKKTKIDEYKSIKRGTGIIATKINENDAIANVLFMNEEDLILITKKGMSIHFETKNINPLGRVAAGVKSIKLLEDDEVLIGLPIIDDKNKVAIFSKNGLAKKSSIDDFPIQGRNGKGICAYKPTNTSGEVIGATIVNDDDNILLVGKPNGICISATEIPLLGRASTGNIMIKNTEIKKVIKL